LYKKFIFFILSVLVVFLIVDLIFPIDKTKLFKCSSTIIYDRNSKPLRLKLSSDGFWRFSISSKEIPSLLKKSVITFEDQYFYYHFGINPFSIVRAIFQNTIGKRVVGASTITMQVSRMMYRRDRTIFNKLIEIFNALQLELHFSKDEILALYFNLAPYGGNIEGVKSASMFYFQKQLDDLTISQIAILTTIPKNPNANRPDRQKNLEKRRDRVLENLRNKGVINQDQYNRAKLEDIISKRIKIPFYAPHFINQIRIQSSQIYTTLDLKLQKFVKESLSRQSEKLKSFDAYNASAVVIHNPTMQVLAYVGSHNFDDKDHDGENNGVSMIRSAGSTLKPFIYALAFDEGFITPKQQIYDIDLFFQGYSPKNFNKRSTGLISVEEALQYSLNIPAVSLNHVLRDNSLYELLKKVGIKSINREKFYYGDSIALGGCGISLFDLTLLYSALANSGVKKEACFLMSDSRNSVGVKILSKESSYLVSEILSDATRMDLSGYWESTADVPKVAFKTGTSASSKDMFTIGYTPEYSVGVWFGNFNGKKTQNLTGLNSASGVVHEIFHYLGRKQQLKWFEKPKNIIKSVRCIDAIKIDKCKTSLEDLRIKGVEVKLPCELIRAETLAFLIKTKVIKSILDLKNNSCFGVWNSYKPMITSPSNHSIITQNRDLPKEFRKIKFNCSSFSKEQDILWFIDDKKPLKSTSNRSIYLYLEEGNHVIGCLDDRARLKIHNITIKSE
jgi:penicillin-binding protein 1C